MAAKREEPVLHMRGWINDRTTIAVARFSSQMIQGYFYPVTYETGIRTGNWVQDWDWCNKFVPG